MLKKNDLIIFCILFISTVILLIGFFPMHYAVDTYVIADVRIYRICFKMVLSWRQDIF